MNNEAEAALIKLSEQFEEWSKKFMVGLEAKEAPALRWYTPKAMTLRVLKVGASVAPAEIQLALGALHGCVELFGFTGTVRLGLSVRRKYAGKAKAVKATVPRPGVQVGSNANPQ